MQQLRPLLDNLDFRKLWTAQIVSDLGDSLTLWGLMFLVMELTGSEASVAGVLIAGALPRLLVSMPAGVWVDRLNRKAVMVASDVLRAGLVLLLLFARDPGWLWLMYGVIFLHSSVGTFFNPAKMALVPDIVGRDQLLAANSVGESSRVIFGLVGTTAAGLIVGLSGSYEFIFIVDAMTFVVSAMQVARIESPGTPPSRDDAAGLSMRAELWEGLATFRQSRLLLGLLVGVGLTMFGLGAVNALLVPFVIGELGMSETWFGALEASQVVSMAASGAIVAALATRLKPQQVIPVGLAGIGVLIAAVATTNVVWQLMVILFLVGWLVTPLQASAATLLQTESPPEKLGRAGAAFNAVTTGASVASMAVAGSLAVAIGVRSVFVTCGLVVLLAAAVSGALLRAPSTAPSEPAEVAGR